MVSKLFVLVDVLIVVGYVVKVFLFDVFDVVKMECVVVVNGFFDIFINFVGLVCYFLVLEMMEVDFDFVSDFNVKGVYFLICVVVKGLVDVGKFGLLINIFS